MLILILKERQAKYFGSITRKIVDEDLNDNYNMTIPTDLVKMVFALH